jgi:sulfite exporter TauE/SafE
MQCTIKFYAIFIKDFRCIPIFLLFEKRIKVKKTSFPSQAVVYNYFNFFRIVDFAAFIFSLSLKGSLSDYSL